MESDLQNSEEKSRILSQKSETTEAENERLKTKVTRLEVEKEEVKRRFLQLENARTTREEERKELISSLRDDLQQVRQPS